MTMVNTTRTNHEYQMNNIAIPMDHIMKDLGVSFQSNFKFDKHVSITMSMSQNRQWKYGIIVHQNLYM